VGPNLVCRAELQCSREEVSDQLARFAVPGRDPSRPVVDGDFSVVYDPKTGLPGGLVKSYVGDEGLKVVNVTSPLHVFHQGVIIRWADQRDDGSWYVTTRGSGIISFPA
jgi:hypothetical protein